MKTLLKRTCECWHDCRRDEATDRLWHCLQNEASEECDQLCGAPAVGKFEDYWLCADCMKFMSSLPDSAFDWAYSGKSMYRAI